MQTVRKAMKTTSDSDKTSKKVQRLQGLPTIPLALAAAAWALLQLCGCGYVIGDGFPPEVRSVHVPVFQSETFRRGLEVQLTEAVQREIQKRTHFVLADRPVADTELTGKIVQVTKRALSETQNDEPRQLELSMAVEVTWRDLRDGRILAHQSFPIDPAAVQLSSQSRMAPEVGQSLATAQTEVINQLARRIVNMMESPW